MRGVFIIFDPTSKWVNRENGHWAVWFENKDGIGRVYRVPESKCRIIRGRLEVPAECLLK